MREGSLENRNPLRRALDKGLDFVLTAKSDLAMAIRAALVAGLALSTVPACGTDPNAGTEDAFVQTPDSDAGQPDAGQPGMDAAEPGLDAAQPGEDAAQPGLDAAQPGPDASMEVWILGGLGENCDTSCTSLGKVCVVGDWNDDAACSVCDSLIDKTIDSRVNCGPADITTAPLYFYASSAGHQCRYRTISFNQDCAGATTATKSRICKCQ